MKINLENKRNIFFQVGLIVALSISFLAFEWKTPTKYDVFEGHLANMGEIEELPPITKEPEKPKPLHKKHITTILDIVEDDVDIEDDIIFDVETDEDEIVGIWEPTPEDLPDEDYVAEIIDFYKVEKKPEFPGGDYELLKFIAKNVKYPKLAIESGIQGTVYVGFVINRKGKVVDVVLLRSIGGGCDEEAVRVIKAMPIWSPGMQRTKPVKVAYQLPVKFKLQ